MEGKIKKVKEEGVRKRNKLIMSMWVANGNIDLRVKKG